MLTVGVESSPSCLAHYEHKHKHNINYSFAPSHFPAFDKYKKLGRTCGPSVLKKGRVLGYGSIPKTESLIRLSMIWMLQLQLVHINFHTCPAQLTNISQLMFPLLVLTPVIFPPSTSTPSTHTPSQIPTPKGAGDYIIFTYSIDGFIESYITQLSCCCKSPCSEAPLASD